MEMPFYDTIFEFKEYYEDNLVKYQNLSKLEILRYYQKIYSNKGDEDFVLFTEYSGKLFQLANNYDFYVSRLNFTNRIPQTFVSEHGLIIGQIVREVRFRKAEITRFDLDFISGKVKDYNTLSEDFALVNGRLNNYQKILDFIAEQITYCKMPVKMKDKKQNVQYDDEILKLADEVFSGDTSKLELLKYLSDNFTVTAKNFTDLTKYNQIYFYLNRTEKIPQNPYKRLIKKVFDFDYNNSEIKGRTETHQITLQNKYLNFIEE